MRPHITLIGGQTGILTIHESPVTIHSRKLSEFISQRGCSSMVERQLPKLHTRVRFPSPACLSDFELGSSSPNFRRNIRTEIDFL